MNGKHRVKGNPFTLVGDRITPTVTEVELDMDGGQLLNCQTVNDILTSGPGYHFDGVNDYINVADIVFPSGTEDRSVIVQFSMQDRVVGRLFSYGTWSGDNAFELSVDNSLSIIAHTNNYSGSIIIPLNTETIVAAILSAGDLTTYINSVVDIDKVTTTIDTILSGIGYVGMSMDNNKPHDGMCHLLLLFNLVLTETEVKAFSSGASVPYKYLGASQSEQLVNNDFSSTWTGELPDGWGLIGTVDANSYLVKDDVNDRIQIYTDNLDSIGISQTILEIGKEYKYTIDIETFTSGTLIIWSGDTVAQFTTNGIHTGRFTATNTNCYVQRLSANNVNCILNSVSIIQVGCVLQLEPDGICHNQWLDNSGNELHGDVSGALSTNLPPGHREKYIDLTVTGDTSFTLPTGYLISSIILESDGAIGGGIDVGLTAGGGEIVAAEAIAGAGVVLCTLVSGANYNLTGADDTIYVTDADGTGWDGATVALRVNMERVV